MGDYHHMHNPLLKMATPSDPEECHSGKQFQADESLKKQLSAEQPSLPRAADRKRTTGYDCEFVEDPPKAFQTDCPICLLILREPYQASCCGFTYCHACIEQVQLVSKPCPTCNQVDFSLFQDKRLRRSLHELSVRCPHVKEGCEWTGELGGLDKHLNESPSPGEHCLVGCEFASVECIHCAESFQRRYVTTHQIEECRKRPFSCDYCSNYESDYEDVTQSHWPTCGYYPIFCPNHCTPYAIEQQKMEDHLKKECPLMVVGCDFHGCDVQLPRKDMPAHLAESLPLHLSLLAVQSRKMEEENVALLKQELASHGQKLSRVITEKDEEIAKLRADLEREVRESRQKVDELLAENRALREETQELMRAMEEKNRDIVKPIEREIMQLKSRQANDRSLLQTLESYASVLPIELTMSNFKQYKESKTVWFSEPFYTHPYGYKMCLSVDPNVSGQVSAFSLWFQLMRGEFDDSLSWPFQGQIMFQLINQLDVKGHRLGGVSLTNCNNPSCISRVTTGERAEGRWGYGRFITTSELDYNPKENCQYLKDDCLRFRIIRVANVDLAAMLQKQYQPVLSRVCIVPINFTLDGFEQRKEKGPCWLSPPFYTHPRGYRMCLHVDVFGWGDCSGTHIAVFVCLMPGEFDNYLKWPFRGNITIQLLNQLEDKNHSEFTIHFTQTTPDSAAGRVTSGERGETWDLFQNEFLSYDALNYNRARKTLYLDNDCLHFRVAKVELKN